MDHAIRPGITPPAPGLDREEPGPVQPEKDIPDDRDHGTSSRDAEQPERAQPPEDERGTRDVERE